MTEMRLNFQRFQILSVILLPSLTSLHLVALQGSWDIYALTQPQHHVGYCGSCVKFIVADRFVASMGVIHISAIPISLSGEYFTLCS